MLLLKYTGKGRLGVALLLWALAGLGVASQGYIEKAGTRMPVVDSVAVVDERLNRLAIYLLPTRLTADEKRRIGKTNALVVLMNKGSPDRKKWGWYPYAKLELQYRSSGFDSEDNLYAYALLLQGIRQKNLANTINGHFADQERLQGYRFEGDRVQLGFSGHRQGVETRWDLEVNAPILERETEKTDLM